MTAIAPNVIIDSRNMNAGNSHDSAVSLSSSSDEDNSEGSDDKVSSNSSSYSNITRSLGTLKLSGGKKVSLRRPSVSLGVDFTRQFSSKPSLVRDEEDVKGSEADAVGGCGPHCSCAISAIAAAKVLTKGQGPGTPVHIEWKFPDNAAFRSLQLPVEDIKKKSKLLRRPMEDEIDSNSNVTLHNLCRTHNDDRVHLPTYVTPHPPFHVSNYPILDSRYLTLDGATKRTIHFALDVTYYPDELEGVDFKVGGAIGICPPNDGPLVEEIFTLLNVPEEERGEEIMAETKGGRWPTIWGAERARRIPTSRRELLTWTVDVNGGIMTPEIMKVLAYWNTDKVEQAVLEYLASDLGQASLHRLRSSETPPSLVQLLFAFPHAKPPLERLLSVLPTLMPRWYSLSSDPHMVGNKRVIEFAVTVHETPEPWRYPEEMRTGICSGYLERVHLEREERPDRVMSLPIFRGLQGNPLAKEFRVDGPMLLIGAGVGIAPFRGFVQARLKSASCANKVWVLQGCRDHLVDELYSGEWGVTDQDFHRVVESRAGKHRYVQDELIAEKDLVWKVMSHPDGRIFVCGSTKGMGEGVYKSLVRVAEIMGHMNESQAKEFWAEKARQNLYVQETW